MSEVTKYHSEPVTTAYVLGRNQRNSQPEKGLVMQGALESASPTERAAYFKFASRTVRTHFYLFFILGFLIQMASLSAEKPSVDLLAMSSMVFGLIFLHFSQMFHDRHKECKTASLIEGEEEPKSVVLSRKNFWLGIIFTFIVGGAGYYALLLWSMHQ